VPAPADPCGFGGRGDAGGQRVGNEKAPLARPAAPR